MRPLSQAMLTLYEHDFIPSPFPQPLAPILHSGAVSCGEILLPSLLLLPHPVRPLRKLKLDVAGEVAGHFNSESDPQLCHRCALTALLFDTMKCIGVEKYNAFPFGE